MEKKQQNAAKTVDILLVEDNLGDAALMRETMKLSSFPIRLNVAHNGEEAMKFLLREEPFSDSPRPSLILLDLTLPKKDGREVLKEIKSNADLRSIPVLILTASRADADIRTSYEFEANFYLVKPMNLEQFSEMMKYLEEYWLKNIAAGF